MGDQADDTKPRGISLHHRLVAAGGASIAAALATNPLDVVKTRMQAQAAELPRGLPSGNVLLEKWAIASCPSTCVAEAGTHRGTAAPPLCYAQPDCSRYVSTMDGFRKIVRREGFSALWKGTDVALLMAIPMVGVYLPLYDQLEADMRGQLGVYAPLAAGALARTAAVLCTSPLELLRTRVVGTPGVPQRWDTLLESSHKGPVARVRHLWTGVGATLARDVPFSAIYWGLLEPLRGAMLGDRRVHTAPLDAAAANLASGAIAGAAAAVVTTPLDVVKTRAQLGQGHPLPVWQALLQVEREGGARALFAGVTPRAARAAPACAIVVASYELLKALYSA
eukprot:jgi/Botrbrau1/20328/Bobra.0006s0010.1